MFSLFPLLFPCPPFGRSPNLPKGKKYLICGRKNLLS